MEPLILREPKYRWTLDKTIEVLQKYQTETTNDMHQVKNNHCFFSPSSMEMKVSYKNSCYENPIQRPVS